MIHVEHFQPRKESAEYLLIVPQITTYLLFARLKCMGKQLQLGFVDSFKSALLLEAYHVEKYLHYG